MHLKAKEPLSNATWVTILNQKKNHKLVQEPE